MKPKAGVVVAIAWFAVCGMFVAIASRDQSAGGNVLADIASFVKSSVHLGAFVASQLAGLTILLAAVLVALFLWAAAERWTPSIPGAGLTFLGVAVTVCGQAMLVLQKPEAGTVLWIAGGITTILGLDQFRRGGSLGWRGTLQRESSVGETEILVVILLIFVAALFRFYRLDQIVNYFEGELAPYYAAATSLRGMWLADAGIHGPWAPLHLSFYLPVWLTAHIFGSTVLSIRVAAALVSLSSIPLVYALARRVAGRPAALFATSLFILDPLQIGWGRSDIHPHASTLWAPLLVCLALLRALERRRVLDFALLALAMGASWQTYPSGQVAVLIPFLFFSIAYLTRFHHIRWLGFKPLIASLGGLALWVASIPLPWLIAEHRWHFPNLVHEFGNRTSWDAAPIHGLVATMGHVAHLAAINAMCILGGIFYRVPLLFHQTFLPTVPGFPPRSFNWTALPLAVLGVAVAFFVPLLWRARVIVAWAVVAALPSVLSDQGFIKRAATLYPALLILAGVGFAVLWNWIGRRRRSLRIAVVATAIVGLLGLASFQSYLWFSGRFYPAGTPAVETSLRALRPYLQPGTIVVLDAAHPFLPGMATYLLLDTLADQNRFPVAWIPASNGPASFSRLLEDPREGLTTLSTTPWYLWTKLRPLRLRLMSTNNWKRAVFLFQDLVPHETEEPRVLADLKRTMESHQSARVARLPGPRDDYRLKVVIFDLDSPRTQPSTLPAQDSPGNRR